MSRLPEGFERCVGVGSDDEGWREGCEDCLRRTTQTGQVWMEPPPVVVFECEGRVAP